MSRILDMRMCSHIGESSIAVVVIQNAAAVPENEQVREAVIVVVADRDPHAEEVFCAYTGPDGHVTERSVSIVAVESASSRLRWFVGASGGAIHQIKVEQTVLVVVNPAAAGAHGLDQKFLRRGSVVMLESDARSACNINESYDCL